ncbi:hypothetical protein SteCoe_11213 [Stentor coeruleus]|uniref:Uncharacterized protein n=1 Tax=Stentor coeruleus TaxID=5963 RepID=A0A1R2CDP9_9CILI|nr:hypothetical protein SteCoe_11213 [Stentor coeruleus]
MLDSYNLSVVKIEGIYESSNSYCYIYHENNILRVLTLEYFEVQPISISKGIIRVVIEDSSNSKTIASLSLSSNIFKRIGFHWLPLFTENEQCLSEVPEEVGLPRLLIDIQPNILSPVQELTEESENAEEFVEEAGLEDFNHLRIKALNMRIKISELEENLLTQKRIFDEELEFLNLKNTEKTKKLEDQVKKLQDTIGKNDEENARFIKEIIGLKGVLNDIENQKDMLGKKVDKVVEDAKARENSILVMLQQKDLEIFALNMKNKRNKENKICNLGGFSIRGIKIEKKVFHICKAEDVKIFMMKKPKGDYGIWKGQGFEIKGEKNKETSNEVGIFDEENGGKNGGILFHMQKCKENTEIIKNGNLCEYNISDNEGKYEFESMIKEKECLSRKLFEAEMIISSFKLRSLEDIDNKVKNFLTSRKLDNFATVCNELVYTIASKKINVFVKNNVIYCKVGHDVKKLDWFIRNNCAQEVDNFKKRQSSNGGMNNHKRFYTSMEFEKVSSSIIHKNFDGCVRAKSNKRMLKGSPIPTNRQAFSPIIRNTTNLINEC